MGFENNFVKQRPEGELYAIKAGDTLSHIAKDYKPDNVDLEDATVRLQEYNGIKDASQIQAGRQIVIPANWENSEI